MWLKPQIWIWLICLCDLTSVGDRLLVSGFGLGASFEKVNEDNYNSVILCILIFSMLQFEFYIYSTYSSLCIFI